MTRDADRFGHRLYDLTDDPTQQTQCHDENVARKLCERMKAMMVQSDAPAELYPRYALNDAHAPLLGLDPHLLPELAAFTPQVRYGLFALLQHLEGSGQVELATGFSPPAGQTGRKKICGHSYRMRFPRSSIRACIIRWR